VGNDVSLKVSQVLNKAYGERMVIPKILEDLNNHQFLGKKTEQGFYLYKGEKRTGRNPAIEKFRTAKSSNLSETDIRERCIFTMINEAARCLSEKIIENPDYLDMALIMGIGFPPFRGGLMRYAHHIGLDYVVDRLRKFEQTYGNRFAPCSYLVELAKEPSKDTEPSEPQSSLV
jgi:3-hydroxyacyl-CoA dehydrogenase/enoyl-CoA hydratase/3-hydroxybutyryl-CoA epimerase